MIDELLAGLQWSAFQWIQCAVSPVSIPWRRLAATTSPSAYHRDFDWYRSFLTWGWKDPGQVHFRVASNGKGQIRMICPLERRREFIRRVPFRVWALPGSGTEDPELYDVRRLATGCDILHDGQLPEEEVLSLIQRHLGSLAPRPGLLLFGRVTPESTA